tara:strand:+ start:588 stop:815 length:228 start_codon:yes stop_codon:yes gene_type:complete
LPAENTITDAISQITQEYKRLKKDAPKKQAPKIRKIQQTSSLSKLQQTLKSSGFRNKPKKNVAYKKSVSNKKQRY